MDSDQKIAFLETTLERLLSWIEAADSKVGLVLAIDTAMLGVLAALAPSPSGWTVESVILAAVALVLLLISLLTSSVASFPRTEGPPESMIYFKGITEREAHQYERAVSDLTTEQYIQDLMGQCHRNGQIAGAKFAWVRRSMIALYLSVLPWALAVYLLYQRGP